jgi:hypothetical protein
LRGSARPLQHSGKIFVGFGENALFIFAGELPAGSTYATGFFLLFGG